MKGRTEPLKECEEWLEVSRKIFPKLRRRKIGVRYTKMTRKKLGCVTAKIPREFDFDPEALLLGKETPIRKKTTMPDYYQISINQDIQNPALRKQVVRHILIHELLHVEYGDLVAQTKSYSQRKRKKFHVADFEQEVFNRFNQIRELENLPTIQKKEHMNAAIQKILASLDWRKKA
jgi:hypothetical protein